MGGGGVEERWWGRGGVGVVGERGWGGGRSF